MSLSNIAHLLLASAAQWLPPAPEVQCWILDAPLHFEQIVPWSTAPQPGTGYVLVKCRNNDPRTIDVTLSLREATEDGSSDVLYSAKQPISQIEVSIFVDPERRIKLDKGLDVVDKASVSMLRGNLKLPPHSTAETKIPFFTTLTIPKIAPAGTYSRPVNFYLDFTAEETQ